MRLYPTLDVDITYQNFGSAWLGILRGSTENIELTFNGLFNLSATNGELDYRDHAKCVATYWTSYKGMRRFFFNQYFHPRCDGKHGQGKVIRAAMRYAREHLKALRARPEPFLTFDNRFSPSVFVSGTITAERPDTDMKDAMITHAYADKGTGKSVDTE